MIDFERRIEALRRSFDGAGIDGLFIGSAANVAYLTGTAGDDCSLWIGADDAVIMTDFRYREMAQGLRHLRYCETDARQGISDILASVSGKRIGIEAEHIKHADYLKLREKLSGKTLVDTGGLVEALRIVKDKDELDATRRASRIASDCFTHICEFIRPGLTEKHVAVEIEYYMKLQGAEGLSFPTICVSGPNSSRPHGVPSNRIIQEGDFLTMDYGCKVAGYCSDMTRTVAVGRATQEMKDVYSVVLEAQLACCDGLKAGIGGKEGDALARDVIEKAGYGEYFGHGTGHGTGLEIHELPRLSPSYAGSLPENCLTSIEPGIYLPGKFGIRIEDLAIITSKGIINLVSAPKELIVI